MRWLPEIAREKTPSAIWEAYSANDVIRRRYSQTYILLIQHFSNVDAFHAGCFNYISASTGKKVNDIFPFRGPPAPIHHVGG